jgi:hypothetical protein
MRYLLGTDEAGYGPNLGPLVISATVWEVPDHVRGEQLFEHLKEVVAPSPERTKGGDPRVIMADSKALYTPGQGLRRLELGLFAALEAIGRRPKTWQEVWQALSPEAAVLLSNIPWYKGFDTAVPIDSSPEQLETSISTLRSGLAAAGVRIAAVRSRVLFAEEFNALVERTGSKGVVLSNQTLGLAARLIEALPAAASIEVICDKHGGRNRYAPLLLEHFPEQFIEIHGEGRDRSVYRFGPEQRRIEFCFRTRAESCLPAALASMASKYLRELAMHAFNAFWQTRVPNLQPTAGYPQDAKRFRVDIAETQKQLRIADRVLWRVK